MAWAYISFFLVTAGMRPVLCSALSIKNRKERPIDVFVYTHDMHHAAAMFPFLKPFRPELATS